MTTTKTKTTTTARRAYYVRYPRDIANEYSLRYTVGGATLSAADGWERITRREAERLARAERERRCWEPERSGYADAHIYPADD